ncbi:UROS [Symbiodinium sp. CCMP2456]|nr:UROS [Symbiodinium sp. CCMP2456]
MRLQMPSSFVAQKSLHVSVNEPSSGRVVMCSKDGTINSSRNSPSGLEARGFVVDRLNTYTTQPVLKHSAEDLALMEQSSVATFGSPSAVRAWAQATETRPIAACIGGTSRDAAEEAGFDQILCPEKPGIPGWAEVTVQAIRQVLEAR